MSDIKELGEKIQNKFDEIDATHKLSKPPEIETEGVFTDSEGYMRPADDPFEDSPMKMLRGMMGDLKDMALNPRAIAFTPPPSEHKVKIFWLPDNLTWEQINEVAVEIEGMLNDGYCCHIPTVINNYVMMDFSKRKETKEDERQQ